MSKMKISLGRKGPQSSTIPSSDRSGSVATQSALTIGAYGVRILVQAALLILVSYYLGADGFGEFTALMALAITMGTFSTIGFSYLILNRTARAPNLGLKLVIRALPVTFISAAILSPVYYFLSLQFLGTTISFSALTSLIVSELLLVPMLSLIAFYQQGLGHSARSMLIQTAPHIFRLVAITTLIGFYPNGTAELYIYGYFLATLLPTLVIFAATPGIMNQPIKMSLPWRLIKKGVPYALMRAASIAPNELDKTVAYKLVSAGETGIYSFISRAIISLGLPVHAMVLAAQPKIIVMRNSGHQSPNLLILTVISLSLIYGLPLSLVVYFTTETLITGVFGMQNEELTNLAILLALTCPVTCARLSTGGILIAFKKPLQRALIETLAFILFVLLAILITPSMGLSGLVCAFLFMELTMLIAQASYLAILTLNPDRKIVTN